MRTSRFTASLAFLAGLAISSAAWAPPGGNGGGGGKPGRGENSIGIITVGTDPSLEMGLYSDEDENDEYHSWELDAGDCVKIITPAEDGVDRGKLVLFAPFLGSVDCASRRQIKVLGGGDVPELVDARFGCDDVFPKGSSGLTQTSCNLEVRDYDDDGSGEFERTWIIEWPIVNVTHSADADVKQLDDASRANIYRLDAPANGKGKKDKVWVDDPLLPFSFEVTRVRIP